MAELAVTAPSVLRDPGAFESPDSGRQLAVEVIDAHGRILARSLTLGSEILPEDSIVAQALRHGRTGVRDITLDGRPFRMYAAPIAAAGGPASGGAVLVASDTSDISKTLGDLGVAVALSGVAVVVLASLGAALLTRRSLRPLSRLASAAGEIERTADPSRRLPEPATLDEIGQLTGVLNRMLASLEEARAGERRFIADASHELRTPVTALLGNVEYAARHGAEPEVLEDLRAGREPARAAGRLAAGARAGGRDGLGRRRRAGGARRARARGRTRARRAGRVRIGTDEHGDGRRRSRGAAAGRRQPGRQRPRPRPARRRA